MGFFTKITYCVSNNETVATISQSYERATREYLKGLKSSCILVS